MTLVLGVGNVERCDDGVGPHVVQQLRQGDLPDDVGVESQLGEPMGLLNAWQGCHRLVLIDAAAPQGRPGCVRCFDVGQDPLPATYGDETSGHGLGPAHAFELARAIGQLPPR